MGVVSNWQRSKTMNHKIKNSYGTTVGGYHKWHSFLESFIKVTLTIVALLILTAIATIGIWA
jgi:hypothetical protein